MLILFSACSPKDYARQAERIIISGNSAFCYAGPHFISFIFR